MSDLPTDVTAFDVLKATETGISSTYDGTRFGRPNTAGRYATTTIRLEDGREYRITVEELS